MSSHHPPTVHPPELDLPSQGPALQSKSFPEIAVRIPQVFLPHPGVDLTRWAVVACDQYTSQPEYWSQVEQIAGEGPSTLHLTLPEIWLGKPGEAERIRKIQARMQEYLDTGVLEPQTGMMYVERTVEGKTRKGLLLCLDLEKYDYHKESQSLIRATEGTIEERLPPRMKIRAGAPLEFPHILVLIDDPQRTVIEPLAQAKDRLVKRYDFDLMLEGGRLVGYQIFDPDLEAQVIQALKALAEPQAFAEKYGVGEDENVLLFAMGDGNHSLATARAVWEAIKAQDEGALARDHPARYALVEIENVHGEGLEFEPIHRVLLGLDEDICDALNEFYGPDVSYTPCGDCLEMMERVEDTRQAKQAIGMVVSHQYGVVEIANPTANLAVGTLQPFLDQIIRDGRAERIDYIHGKCVICKVTSKPGSVGFFLPHMNKSDLFKTVILDGALPHKTFSMGEAREKRFYVEGRKIA